MTSVSSAECGTFLSGFTAYWAARRRPAPARSRTVRLCAGGGTDGRTWGPDPGGNGGAVHAHRETRRMSTPVAVGFRQRLPLDSLAHTAMLVLAGHTRGHIVTALQELLRHALSVGGTARRGNREKAITMLLQIWVAAPRHLQPFRDEGLAHVQRLPVDDRIVVHWGMAMAVYLFFGAVAAAVGRLVRLQGTCATAWQVTADWSRCVTASMRTSSDSVIMGDCGSCLPCVAPGDPPIPTPEGPGWP
jgi:hypothetical protein